MSLRAFLFFVGLMLNTTSLFAETTPVPAADAAYGAGDYKTAARLWQAACDIGNATGCYELAIVYRDGEGVEPDSQKMLDLYAQACTGREGRACSNLGAAYENGRGVPKDIDRAVSLFGSACDEGVGYACFALSGLYDLHESRVVREDAALANAALLKGCERGDTNSCQNLGYHYSAGYGFERDQLRSASLYLAACDDGESMDCVMLGSHWFTGDGRFFEEIPVAADRKQAAGVYDAVCKAGFEHGCLSLAMLVWRSGKNCTEQKEKIVALVAQALTLKPDYPLAKKFLVRVERGDCPVSPL